MIEDLDNPLQESDESAEDATYERDKAGISAVGTHYGLAK